MRRRPTLEPPHIPAYNVIYPRKTTRIDEAIPVSSPRDHLSKAIIGWQERVLLPDFSTQPFLAKIDTGAVLSCLHAVDLQYETLGPFDYVAFELQHPNQPTRRAVNCRCRVTSFLRVRSSNGEVQCRPIVEANLQLGGIKLPIRLTLTDRSKMQFPLLLGRDVLKDHFLVDSNRSFVLEG